MGDYSLRALLNRPLKSAEILERLRDEDMEVIYDLDLLQEGSPDRYWAAARSAGFQQAASHHTHARSPVGHRQVADLRGAEALRDVPAVLRRFSCAFA